MLLQSLNLLLLLLHILLYYLLLFFHHLHSSSIIMIAVYLEVNHALGSVQIVVIAAIVIVTIIPNILIRIITHRRP